MGLTLSIAATVVVVAPDRTVRESVAFLLEAEGCHVRQHASLANASTALGWCDCAVVDEAAVTDNGVTLSRWRTLSVPAVLLANSAGMPLASAGIQVVEKPILGAALIEAVRAALVPQAQPAAT